MDVIGGNHLAAELVRKSELILVNSAVERFLRDVDCRLVLCTAEVEVPVITLGVLVKAGRRVPLGTSLARPKVTEVTVFVVLRLVPTGAELYIVVVNCAFVVCVDVGVGFVTGGVGFVTGGVGFVTGRVGFVIGGVGFVIGGVGFVIGGVGFVIGGVGFVIGAVVLAA